MTTNHYQRMVRSSAVYDLVMTAAFAVPGLASFKIGLLHALHNSLNLSGSFPTFDTMHLFFVHLLGSIVIVWSVLRIIHPKALFGFYDSIARFAFSVMMIWALIQGGTELILFFLIPEFIWGVYQLLGYMKQDKKQALRLAI